MRDAGLEGQVPAWEDLAVVKTHELHTDLADGEERVDEDREALQEGRGKAAPPPRSPR